MKKVGFVGLTLLGLALVTLALVAFPATSVTAQGDSTPVPFGDLINPPAGDGGGGLVIPTATPAGGGFVIPTATPAGGSGFVIPTATPAGVVAAPQLSEDQLRALNLQPGDVPAPYSNNPNEDDTDIAQVVQQARDAGYADFADSLEQLSQKFGWTNAISLYYSACDPALPITEISSEIAPLASAEAAAAFIDDPDVHALFEVLQEQFEPVPTMHAYYVTAPPDEGKCFSQEIKYGIVFDYQNLMVWLSMTANAETDPALVRGLLDQLVPVMQARLQAAMPAEQVGPSAPPPAQPPSVVNVTLDDLGKLMPSLNDLGLPAPPFQYNPESSGMYTLDDMIALLQNYGLTELANAMQTAGQRDGLVGEIIGVWDTGEECPDTVGLSVEVDLTLFQTPEGALAYLNDPGIQQAWINTGLVSTFQPHGDGVLASGTSTQHRCGTVQLYTLVVPQGRVLVTASAIGNADASQDDLVSALEMLVQYMQQQIADAGIG